jgi:hypothetical protein
MPIDVIDFASISSCVVLVLDVLINKGGAVKFMLGLWFFVNNLDSVVTFLGSCQVDRNPGCYRCSR